MCTTRWRGIPPLGLEMGCRDQRPRLSRSTSLGGTKSPPPTAVQRFGRVHETSNSTPSVVAERLGLGFILHEPLWNCSIRVLYLKAEPPGPTGPS
jgi:hypothetical protein